jgi:hypothetical protein
MRVLPSKVNQDPLKNNQLTRLPAGWRHHYVRDGALVTNRLLPFRRSVCSTIPGRELQRSLVRISAVHRFAVGNDHPLERKHEHRSQGWEDQLIVPGRRPHPKLAFWRGKRVCENERVLLRQPDWRLVAPLPVI